MIQGYGPVTQALLGTLLTWGFTALGSLMVIFLRGNQVNKSSITLPPPPKTNTFDHSINLSRLLHRCLENRDLVVKRFAFHVGNLCLVRFILESLKLQTRNFRRSRFIEITRKNCPISHSSIYYLFVYVSLKLQQRKSLDIALGFAAGVMIAASFWSLLAPAIELAVTSGLYGAKGEFAFVPVAGGFLLGSIFVFATDKVISYLGINSPHMMIGMAVAIIFTIERDRNVPEIICVLFCFWQHSPKITKTKLILPLMTPKMHNMLKRHNSVSMDVMLRINRIIRVVQ